jgi:YD repeat-containing protein
VDNRGLVTAMVDPNGNTTNYTYDAAGRRVTAIAPPVTTETFGGSPLSLRPLSKTGYNTFGDAVETQDPLGNLTQVRVDAAGRPVKTILPDYHPAGRPADRRRVHHTGLRQARSGHYRSPTRAARRRRFEYDSLGNRGEGDRADRPRCRRPPTTSSATCWRPSTRPGPWSTATYDFLGRKLTASQVVRQPAAAVNTTTFDYGAGVYGETADAGPWLRGVTSPDGVTSSMTYDVLGQQLTVRDGAGNTTSTQYDGLGSGGEDDAAGPDPTDGAVRRRGAGGAHPVAGRGQRGAQERGGHLRQQRQPHRGDRRAADHHDVHLRRAEPAHHRGPAGHHHLVDHHVVRVRRGGQPDPVHRRAREPCSGPPTTAGTGRSRRSKPATAAYPNLADRTFTVSYDAAGRVVSQLAPGGVRIDNAYDDLNQLIGQTGTGAEVATGDRSFGYDDAGRVTSLSTPGGSNTLTYDDRACR